MATAVNISQVQFKAYLNKTLYLKAFKNLKKSLDVHKSVTNQCPESPKVSKHKTRGFKAAYDITWCKQEDTWHMTGM